MKKLLALAVAAIMTAGLFALDLGGIKGTWQDKKWDADWTFSADGKIVLTKTSTGEEVYTFKDGTVQNFKVKADTTGVSISFDCKDPQRSYSFKKGLTLDADLDMVVNPDWTKDDYETVIKFKR